MKAFSRLVSVSYFVLAAVLSPTAAAEFDACGVEIVIGNEINACLNHPIVPEIISVPAPATIELISLGLACLGWSRRKKK